VSFVENFILFSVVKIFDKCKKFQQTKLAPFFLRHGNRIIRYGLPPRFDSKGHHTLKISENKLFLTSEFNESLKLAARNERAQVVRRRHCVLC